MIDHVSVRVQDLPRLLTFYREALAPIGYQVVMESPGAVGLGADGKPDLWLMQTDKPLNPTHVALSATREAIDRFHAAGLAAGGRDNGAPGLRLDYHPSYYAAFVLDPERNDLEVVYHVPPGAPRAARTAGKAKAKKRRPVQKAKAVPREEGHQDARQEGEEAPLTRVTSSARDGAGRAARARRARPAAC